MTTPDAAALAAHQEQLAKGIKAAERLLAFKKARDDLETFCRLMMPDPEDPDDVSKSLYDVQAHHRLFMRYMQEVEAGRRMRFGLSVPPQHGKSQILSKFFVAWFLGRHPERHVIVGTYSSDFAESIGDEVRTLLSSPIYKSIFPGTQLRHGSKAKDEMRTTRGGSATFVGRGKATTGRPCDLFIIDDAYKDYMESQSTAIREDVWNWYSSVVFSRCRITTPIVVVHTRWHQDDLLGRLCDPEHPLRKHNPKEQEKAKRWRYVNIPAVLDNAEIAEALGKKVGEALWPERFPLELLNEAKDNDPLVFSALYLGKPSPESGSYFKADWIQEYDPHELPQHLTYYAAMDLAVSPEANRDASALMVVGVDMHDNMWLVDALHCRLEADDLVDAIIDKLEEWKPLSTWVEKGPIWKALSPFMQKRMAEREVWVPISDVAATKDKQTRAQSFRARMAQGKVFFPRSAPWWLLVRDELLKFPTGANDDCIDALAYLGLGLRRQVGAGPKTPEKPKAQHGTAGWLRRLARDLDRRRRISEVGEGL